MKFFLSLFALSSVLLSACNNNPTVSYSYYEPSAYYHVTDSLGEVQYSQFTWCKVPYPTNAEISYNLDVDQNGSTDTKLVLRNAYFGSQIISDKPKDEKKDEKDEKDELLIVRFLEYRGSVSDNLGVGTEFFYSCH